MGKPNTSNKTSGPQRIAPGMLVCRGGIATDGGEVERIDGDVALVRTAAGGRREFPVDRLRRIERGTPYYLEVGMNLL